MSGPVRQAYREVLKLVKRLPPSSRGYYSQYARENFVTYSEAQDPALIRALLARTHHHTCWILKKYGVDEAAANKLKEGWRHFARRLGPDATEFQALGLRSNVVRLSGDHGSAELRSESEGITMQSTYLWNQVLTWMKTNENLKPRAEGGEKRKREIA